MKDKATGELAEKAFRSFTHKLMSNTIYDGDHGKVSFSVKWYDQCLAEVKTELNLMEPENRAALALFGIKIVFSSITVSESQQEPVQINP